MILPTQLCYTLLCIVYVIIAHTGVHAFPSVFGQFGGLEAIATGILDEWPQLRKRRELFILGLMLYCFMGGLATTTYVCTTDLRVQD